MPPLPHLTRRQLFRVAGLTSVALTSGARRALAQEKQPPPLAPLNRFARNVHEWYVEQVRAAEKIGEATRAKLKSKADAEGYIRDVRAKIAQCFGPFPAQKSPLNAKVTGKLERDAYTIEKIVFESRPNFFVTANL